MAAVLVLLLIEVVSVRGCYWNNECPYMMYSSKTPYDSIRGDIRDYPAIPNCEAVSVWNLNRHGNRNPGDSVTESMKEAVLLKDAIITSYDAGNSTLCAQDIDLFRKWTWNESLDVSQSYLTGEGYEEMFELAQRIRQKYPHLLQGTADQFYFRPTNEQRTITSSIAYVHGLTDGINLNVTHDNFWDRDDIIRPYQNCDRYQDKCRGGQVLADQLDTYFKSFEYVAVQNAVQQRLGISTILSSDNIFAFYELCRFYRSWTKNLQSPWCAVFTDDDLLVLEYYDDVRHYYRNGYGSWINVNLGKPALKDLYENFEAVIQGNGKKIVGYFSHDTMLEMVLSAMGLFKDDAPLQASYRNPNRLWKTSFISAFSVNIIAVLNRCGDFVNESYRVQLFVNEKETTICPLEGCTWQEFQEKFQPFTSANLDFCNMDYDPVWDEDTQANSGSISRAFWTL